MLTSLYSGARRLQNSLGRTRLLESALLLFLVTALLFLHHRTRTAGGWGNSLDVLPRAYQFVNPDWLADDWYLNTPAAYRWLFDWVAGNLMTVFGPDNIVAIELYGEHLLLLLTAVALYTLFRGLRIHVILAAFVVYLFAVKESYFSGEWVIGFETKSFAWLFVFLSLAMAVRSRYLWSIAAAVAASLFHILVGGFSLLALLVALSVEPESRRWLWRKSRQRWIVASLMLVASVPAAWMFYSALPLETELLKNAAHIYAYLRLPHHLVPTIDWLAITSVVSAVFLLGLGNEQTELRLLSSYGLVSCTYVWVAWLAGWLGFQELHVLYLGRHAGVIVPLLALLLGAAVLSGRLRQWARFRWLQHGVVAAVLILTIVELPDRLDQVFPAQRRSAYGGNLGDALRNTRQLTAKRDLIWISPAYHRHYFQLQRPVFVSYKHLPQQPRDIVEWHERIHKSSGGIRIQKRRVATLRKLEQGFYGLDETWIKSVAREYGITHYLGKVNAMKQLPEIWRNTEFVLYDLR